MVFQFRQARFAALINSAASRDGRPVNFYACSHTHTHIAYSLGYQQRRVISRSFVHAYNFSQRTTDRTRLSTLIQLGCSFGTVMLRPLAKESRLQLRCRFALSLGHENILRPVRPRDSFASLLITRARARAKGLDQASHKVVNHAFTKVQRNREREREEKRESFPFDFRWPSRDYFRSTTDVTSVAK